MVPENRRTFLPGGWSSGKAFLAVFAATLAERLLTLIVWYRREFPSDGKDYVAVGQMLRAGTHFTPYWPPGLPMYLGILAPGGGPLSVRLAMLGLWGLFCVGFYQLAKALRIADWAWIALLVFGLSPTAVQMSLDPLTEMPVGALLLTGLSAAILCLHEAAWWDYVVMGGSFGLMALVRPSALPLCLAIPLLCGFRSRRWLPNAGAAVLALVLVGAWVADAHRLCGSWLINTANGKNLWFGNNADTPDYRTWYFGSHHGEEENILYPEYAAAIATVIPLDPVAQNTAFQQMAVQFIEAHPGKFLLRTTNRVRCYFGFDTFTALSVRERWPQWFWPTLGIEAILYCVLAGFSAFYIASAVGTFWRSAETWVLLVASALYALPYWVSMSHPTYHFPVVAPLLLLGILAWRQSVKTYRGWIGVALLAAVQAEWIWQMSQLVAIF